jgi:hypothetical protein
MTNGVDMERIAKFKDRISLKTDSELGHMIKSYFCMLDKAKRGRMYMTPEAQEGLRVRFEIMLELREKRKRDKLDQKRNSWLDYWDSFC